MTAFHNVDTFWIGRSLGAESLAAVTGAVFWVWLVISVGEMVSIGLDAIAARRHGERRPQDAARTVGDGFVLALLLGAAIALATPFVLGVLFDLLETSASVSRIGRDYLGMYFLGMPLIFGFFAVDAAFRARGETRTPLWILAVTTVLGLLLDPVLIRGLGPFPALGVRGAALATLVPRGLACVVLAPRSLADMLDDLARLGRLLGVERRADTLREDLREQIAALEREANTIGAPARVYLEWWPRPMFSPGQACYSNELIRLAGGVNVFGERPGSSLEIRPDELVAADPEVCFVSWCGVAADKLDPRRLIERPGLGSLAAARAGHVYPLDERFSGRPGPRMLEAARIMAAGIRRARQVSSAEPR